MYPQLAHQQPTYTTPNLHNHGGQPTAAPSQQAIKDVNKIHILIVEDDQGALSAMESIFTHLGYRVTCADNIWDANRIVGFSLIDSPWNTINHPKINIAILDLNLITKNGTDNGGEFGDRLHKVAPEINIIIMTGDYEMAANLPYVVDGIVIKASGLDTLQSVVKDLSGPVRNPRTHDVDLKLSQWCATAHLKGFHELRGFTHEGGCKIENDDGVTKITARTKDGQWVNSVIYPRQEGNDQNTDFIGISTTLGCPIGCPSCINWRFREDEHGQSVKFLRKLTVGEMIGQVYLAMFNKSLKTAFEGYRSKKIVVNWTVEGDPAYNMKNCCSAIKQLSQINTPRLSFILTTVGTAKSLSELLSADIDFKKVRLYWSLDSLVSKIRSWLKPGQYENLEVLRFLFEEFAKLSGNLITISWVIIKGINDRQEDAEMLAKFFNGRPFEIKLMPLVGNNLKGVHATAIEELEEFDQKLVQAGLNIPRRKRFILGQKLFAACANTTTPWDKKPRLD